VQATVAPVDTDVGTTIARTAAGEAFVERDAGGDRVVGQREAPQRLDGGQDVVGRVLDRRDVRVRTGAAVAGDHERDPRSSAAQGTVLAGESIRAGRGPDQHDRI
jgi:hypothetical protein